MKYSIIIPFHSNKGLLEICVQAVVHTVPKDTEIIIVANNYGASEFELPVPKMCTILNIDRPLYYPKAVNLGAQAAHGEYIVLMDADICARQGWLEAFRTAFEQYPDVGGCSAKMLDPFDGSVKEFGIGFTGYNFPHPFMGRHENDSLVNGDREVQAFCSAMSMYRRDVYLAIGGMNEQLVDGYSDIDLCLRLHERGFHTYVVGNAVGYHHGASTSGSGMSSHLRADTKGYFMSHDGSRCQVDMNAYYQLAFHESPLQFESEYFLVDFSTIADYERHYDLFAQLGRFKLSSTYRLPPKVRDIFHIPLYTQLDDNIRRWPQPIFFFVDDFRALRHNYIWQELRDCRKDLVIDRNANLFSFGELAR